MNTNKIITLNFSYSLNIPNNSYKKNISILIYNNILKITNNTYIKNTKLYLNYKIQTNITQIKN